MVTSGVDEHDPDNGPDLLAGLLNAKDLDAKRLDPLRWTVPGVIPEGLTLLVGAPKLGKSWMALSIALAAATGGQALGSLQCDPRPVLLLALEDGERRLQERLRLLAADQPLPESLSILTRLRVPGALQQTVAQWINAHAPKVPPLVIVDTIGKIRPPDAAGASAYSSDYQFAGKLKRLTDDRPGMSLMGVHHTRKAFSSDFVDTVSGTNGLGGAADSILVLKRDRMDNAALLSVTGRDVSESSYHLTMTDGVWSLTGGSLEEAIQAASAAAATAGLGDLMESIVSAVIMSSSPVKAADIARIVGCDQKRAANYLHRAADTGRIAKVGRGIYRSVESVESVETLDEHFSTLSTLSTQASTGGVDLTHLDSSSPPSTGGE